MAPEISGSSSTGGGCASAGFAVRLCAAHGTGHDRSIIDVESARLASRLNRAKVSPRAVSSPSVREFVGLVTCTSSPGRRSIILQELTPHVVAGIDSAEDGIDDARGAVHDIEGRVKAVLFRLLPRDVNGVFV